jgi:hypothetical protein
LGRRHNLAGAYSVLDGSIANVALPTIAADLNAPAADPAWVVNAYQPLFSRKLTSRITTLSNPSDPPIQSAPARDKFEVVPGILAKK